MVKKESECTGYLFSRLRIGINDAQLELQGLWCVHRYQGFCVGIFSLSWWVFSSPAQVKQEIMNLCVMRCRTACWTVLTRRLTSEQMDKAEHFVWVQNKSYQQNKTRIEFLEKTNYAAYIGIELGPEPSSQSIHWTFTLHLASKRTLKFFDM
jgi:hypothetical protein